VPIVLFRPGRARPANFKERSEKMFYGDYSYELARERMDEAIKARERDVLVKQLRAARKGEPPRKSIAARGTALVTALFR
jgi:hypothetical protein